MRPKTLLLTALMLLCAAKAAAQGSLSGTVTDKADGSPISGAVIRIVRSGGKGTEFALTDAHGRYTLNLKAAVREGDSLAVSILGYARAAVPLPQPQPLNFELSEASTKLKEVVVRAPKVKMAGDTIKYDVQSFLAESDINLEDVLRRMPGIEVSENGQVSYNGKPLGNMYIEGLDMVNGRYSLLTKNISPRDVRGIEVLEREQPIKALTGIAVSESPAINIRLRETAKGHWIGNANLNAGADSDPLPLWDAGVYLMRIGRIWNSVNNLKTNNSGVDLGEDYRTDGSRISVNTVSAPLADKRTLFDRQVLATTGNKWKASGGWVLSASVAAYYERLCSENESKTTYWLDDGILEVSEGQKAVSHSRVANGHFEAEKNEDDNYTDNELTVQVRSADAASTMTGSYAGKQEADLPEVSITDAFNLIRRSGRHTFEFNSDNSFLSRNESLDVSLSGADLRQDIKETSFDTDTYAAMNFRLRRGFVLRARGGVQLSLLNLESGLTGLEETAPELVLSNDGTASLTKAYTSVTLSKTSGNRFQMICGIPRLGIAWYGGSGKAVPVCTGHFTMRYSPSAKIDITATGLASENETVLQDIHSGVLLSNYRTVLAGSREGIRNSRHVGQLRLNYKRPVNMLFLEASLSASHSDLRRSQSRDFVGSHIVSGTVGESGDTDSWTASLGGSKGFYGMNGKVSAKLSYSGTSTDALFQNGVRTPYDMRTLTASGDFTGSLTKWASLTYSLTYTLNDLSSGGTRTKRDRVVQSLSTGFFPAKGLEIRPSASHWCNSVSDSEMKHTALIDATLSYTFTGGVKLSLSALNLLNTKAYAYSIFDGLTEFSCDYAIRPLNLLAGAYFTF